jgi:hypothetical protein
MAKRKLDITPKQNKALMALVAGQTNEAAANAAGVSQNTLYRWMKDEKFRDELSLFMQRTRMQFEARINRVANNATVVVQQMLESPDISQRAQGAKLALQTASRLASRYKELQVEGYVPPPTPMIVFPEGSKPAWMNKQLPPAPDPPEDLVVEAEEIKTAKE